MPANPTIKFVSATKSTTDTLIMALLDNTSRGMVQMRVSLTSLCTTSTVANCTTTINSTTVTTTASFAAVVIGMKVTGSGIAADTYVTAKASTISLTISKNATATASGITLTFGPEDTAMTMNWCVEQATNSYIQELYQLVNSYKRATTTATSACLRAYICNAGENCDMLGCTTWNSSFNSTATEIAINRVLGYTPIAVSDLTLTPGDESISVSWGDVNQTTIIWAYDVLLGQSSTLLVSGSRVKNTMPIANLINGTAYTVSVRARSFDGYLGPWTDKTATPVAPPCVDPECKIGIV